MNDKPVVGGLVKLGAWLTLGAPDSCPLRIQSPDGAGKFLVSFADDTKVTCRRAFSELTAHREAKHSEVLDAYVSTLPSEQKQRLHIARYGDGGVITYFVKNQYKALANSYKQTIDEMLKSIEAALLEPAQDVIESIISCEVCNTPIPIGHACLFNAAEGTARCCPCEGKPLPEKSKAAEPAFIDPCIDCHYTPCRCDAPYSMLVEARNELERVTSERDALRSQLEDRQEQRWHDRYNAALSGLLAYSGDDESTFKSVDEEATWHADQLEGPRKAKS